MAPSPLLQRQALDYAPVFLRDLSGRITHWSRRITTLYQYEKTEAVGRLAHELLRTSAALPLRNIEEQVRASGGWRGELVDTRRDGSAVTVLSEWSLLRDNKDAAAGVLVCNAELKTDDSNLDLLASIVDGSHDAIVGKNLQGLITSWNRAAEEMFGYSASEILGHSVLELFPEKLRAQEAVILNSIVAGDRIEHYETVRTRKDGTPIDVALTVSPIRDSRGRVIGASKIARDISEQKQLRLKLDELQRELFHVSRLNDMGQVASAFAHELNQPLAAVGNFLAGSRVALDKDDFAMARRGIAKASEQLLRTAEVVRRLRDFLKKSEDHRHFEDLRSLVEESAALALIGYKEHDIERTVEIAPDAATALVDRVQLQQVLVNLFRNAAEAMSGARLRRITFRARAVDSRWLQIEVSDTGPGFSESMLGKVFQPFNTTKPSGMGVGLSLCRTIVEAHGGEMSGGNGPAGGALFRFTLPTGREA